MHKIEERALFYSVQYRMALTESEVVPPHMRYLYSIGESDYFTRYNAQTPDAGAFLARIKEKLAAEADPEEWPPIPYPLQDRFDQVSFLQFSHGITEGAHPGENHCPCRKQSRNRSEERSCR